MIRSGVVRKTPAGCDLELKLFQSFTRNVSTDDAALQTLLVLTYKTRGASVYPSE